MALSEPQLFMLFEWPTAFTAAEVDAFNAIPIQPEGDDDAALAAYGPWFASIGVTGPLPRVRMLSIRVAGAARRWAEREG